MDRDYRYFDPAFGFGDKRISWLNVLFKKLDSVMSKTIYEIIQLIILIFILIKKDKSFNAAGMKSKE